MAKAEKQTVGGIEYHLSVAYGGQAVPQVVRDLLDDKLYGKDCTTAFETLRAASARLEETSSANYSTIRRYADAQRRETENRDNVASKLGGDVLQYTVAQAGEWLALDAGYQYVLDRLRQEIEQLETVRAGIDENRRSMKAILSLGTLRASDAMPTAEAAALLGVEIQALLSIRDQFRARQLLERQAEIEAERQQAEIRAAQLQVENEERQRIKEQEGIAEAAKFEIWLADINAVPMPEILTLVFGPYWNARSGAVDYNVRSPIEEFLIHKNEARREDAWMEVRRLRFDTWKIAEGERTLKDHVISAALDRLWAVCSEQEAPTVVEPAWKREVRGRDVHQSLADLERDERF